MAIQKTLWSPDTCSCKITYVWDDSISEDMRVITVDSVVSCPEHSGTKEVIYDNVLAENQNKNNVLGHVLENFPLLVEDKDGSKQLIDGIEYKWEFDGSRNLQVEFVGASKLEVPDIQASLDAALGDGKVTVK